MMEKKLLFLLFVVCCTFFACRKESSNFKKMEGTAYVSYDYGKNNTNTRTDTFAVKVELLDDAHFTFTWLKDTTHKGKYTRKDNEVYVFDTDGCKDDTWGECCINCNSISSPILGEFQSQQRGNTLTLTKEIKNVVSNIWTTTIVLKEIE